MITKTALILSVFAFIFIGCRKEMQSSSLSSSSVYNLTASGKGTIDSTGKWFGACTPFLGDPDALWPDTIYEQKLINNGIASDPYDSIAYPSDANRFSNVGYEMPADRVFKGDSIAFEALVTDDVNVVELDMIGTKNTASFSYNSKGDNTCTLAVGNTTQSVTLNPAIDFTTFKPVVFALKGKHAFLYISNKLVLSLAYNSSDDIGNITTLIIGRNNQQDISLLNNLSMDCDYVKLYNSYTKKLLMKEEFNIKGKSNTIYY
jgi:hypothetical protein